MPAGRPPMYKTAEELQEKIDEYFDTLDSTKKITITGLVLYLGFCDRASFYDYGKRKEFSYTIKKARTRIEQSYEYLLHSGNCAGAIFALKNFAWTDKQEIKHSGNIDGLQSVDEARRIVSEFISKESARQVNNGNGREDTNGHAKLGTRSKK